MAVWAWWRSALYEGIQTADDFEVIMVVSTSLAWSIVKVYMHHVTAPRDEFRFSHHPIAWNVMRTRAHVTRAKEIAKRNEMSNAQTWSFARSPRKQVSYTFK